MRNLILIIALFFLTLPAYGQFAESASEFAGIHLGPDLNIDNSWTVLSGGSIVKDLEGDFERVFVDVTDTGMEYIFSSKSHSFDLYSGTYEALTDQFGVPQKTEDSLPVPIAQNSDSRAVEIQVRNDLGSVRYTWNEDIEYETVLMLYSESGLVVRFDLISE
ncbi:MAG: hypothetical protein WED82_02015 [Balneolales bacterium]